VSYRKELLLAVLLGLRDGCTLVGAIVVTMAVVELCR